MGFRLILLMAMGLGAMYMLHLLAEDYDKIRKPVAAVTRALASTSAGFMRGKRDTAEFSGRNGELQTSINGTLAGNWKLILSRDTFGCLQSLICQVISGAEADSREVRQLMGFIEPHLTASPAKVREAFGRGLAFRGMTWRCYDEYPLCLYSAKTMFIIIKWFSDFSSSRIYL